MFVQYSAEQRIHSLLTFSVNFTPVLQSNVLIVCLCENGPVTLLGVESTTARILTVRVEKSTSHAGALLQNTTGKFMSLKLNAGPGAREPTLHT